MPTEEGLVEEIRKGKAKVRVQRSSACKSCSSRDHCEINTSTDVTIEALNEVNAKEGDWVELSVPAGSFLRLSLVVYLFPVVALIVGAVIGNELGRVFGISSGFASVSGGILAIILIYFILRGVNRRSESSNRYRPRLTKILYRTRG